MEPLAVESRVLYHGSIERAHGEFVIMGVADEFLGPDETDRSTDGKRYYMYMPGSKFGDHYGSLRQVRRQSITPVAHRDDEADGQGEFDVVTDD